MRHINSRHLPRLVDLSAIRSAKAAIGALDVARKNDYIEENAKLWSDLKRALWTLGCGKCWYSEASLQEQEGHVEHFRPKRRLWGAAHLGYWWRAFDWGNLRLAHPTVNLRVTDYLTGKKAGKGSYFPLRHEERRANTEAEEVNEEPVLLDPTNSLDCNLICFDSNDGKPVPRYSETIDPWKHKRAKDSIDYYHLDEGTWNYKRKDLMDEIAILCDRIVEVAREAPLDNDRYHQLISELLVYLEPFSEFTSAAFQIVREKGLLEHVYPMPT